MQDINDLIKKHEGLMYKQLHKFGLAHDHEAISLAYESLYNAIKSFDNSTGHKFSTYATVCIYNRLGSYVRSLNTQILQNTISYETPVGDYGMTLMDTLKSPKSADTDVLAEDGVSNIYNAMSECASELSNPLHFKIISFWIASGFKMSTTELAVRASCTQSYASQTLKVFKHKLKKKLGEY